MMILFLILAACAIYLQVRTVKRGNRQIEVSSVLTANLAEPGEQLELVVTLTNRTHVLIPFIKLNIRLPKGVETTLTEKRQHMKLLGEDEIVMSTWAAPMQQLYVRIPVFAGQRGRYLFEQVRVSEGDFLGLTEKTRECPTHLELIVAPKEAPKQALGEIPGSFLGDISVRRFLFEDPVLTVGCREYTGREPMKSIAWSASVRAGELMVKQYDHTMDASVVVVLNIYTSASLGEQRIEECYSLTRTACRILEDRGIKYSVFTDAGAIGAIETLRYVGEGLGSKHMMRVLELLGRSLSYGRYSFDRLLEHAVGMTHGICGILLITPADDKEIAVAAKRCAARKGIGLVTLKPEEVN